MLTSEMQGNVIDLCPVGALTSKPYAFTARPWELKKTESIDVMDGLGSNIRVDTKGREVMRILPRNHDGVNEEWLADRSRFIWDGLRRQRLDRPYLREGGKLRPATWAQAFRAIAEATKGRKVAALAGDLASTEAIFALGELASRLGWTTECRVDGAKLPTGNRSAYVGTARIEDLRDAEMIQLIGTNPRLEAPVLNARIRGAWLRGASVGYLGSPADLTYDVVNVGSGREALEDLAGREIGAAKEKNTIVIVGQGALTGADGYACLAAAMRLAENSASRFLVLHMAAARVGAMDLGFVTEGGLPAALDGAEAIYNLGVDEIDLPRDAFVVYQGSHGDRGAHRADVILPGAAYTEESGIFVNTEGRPQMANRAGFPPGEARENWAILRALSAELGATLPFDTLPALRAAMVAAVPHLGAIDMVPENAWTPVDAGDKTPDRSLGDFTSPVAAHYLANPIMRASTVMAELARMASDRAQPLAAE
jgi:NADH-quinone oxidoreductase subunit G